MNKVHRWVAHIGTPCKVQQNEDKEFNIRLPLFEDNRVQIIRVECLDCHEEVHEAFGTFCQGVKDTDYGDILWSGI